MSLASQRGLPRPVAEDPHGVLRPIPWSQEDTRWGVIDDARLGVCRKMSACLVCGDTVFDGAVFWDSSGGLWNEPKSAPEHVYYEELPQLSGYVSDGGPLHHRCAKLTRCHCRTIRDLIHQGVVTEIPYTYRKEPTR